MTEVVLLLDDQSESMEGREEKKLPEEGGDLDRPRGSNCESEGDAKETTVINAEIARWRKKKRKGIHGVEVRFALEV